MTFAPITMSTAKKYAIENGFTHCRYYRDWMSWRVYIVFKDHESGNDNPPYAGSLTFILDDGHECRFADTDEMHDIMSGRMHFSKNRKTDVIFWVDNCDYIGQHLFSFNKRKIYNLFRDYPHNLTAEQKEIFDRENPYWRKYFAERQ